MKIFTAVLLLLASAPGLAAPIVRERVGRFYEVGSDASGKPLFVQKTRRVISETGAIAHESTIEDSEGLVVMRESASIQGDQIQRQRVEQLQIGEAYELERRKDGKVLFRTFKLNENRSKAASESAAEAPPNFITGPSTEYFLKSRLEGKGEDATVAAEFGVFEVERAVSFEFKVTKVLNEGKEIRVRMKPASFWVKMLVSPMHMDFDSSTFQLTRFTGRTPLRIKRNGNWKHFDALILYADK